MSATNFCRFIGNLTKDPVVRKVNVGGEPKTVADFTIAVNTRRNKDKEKQDVVFVDCTIWNKPAETIERLLTKGDRLSIDGEYRVDVFPHKETGENVYRSKIGVTDFEILKCKKWNEADAPEEKPATPAPAKGKKQKPAPEPEPEVDVEDDDEDEADGLPF